MHYDRNSLPRRIADVILPPLAWLVCRILGLLTWFLTSRRHIAIRNLALAFPDKPASWHRRMAFTSIMRMLEMFAIPLVLPLISDNEARRRFRLAPGAKDRFDAIVKNGPAIIQTPHSATSESLVIVPMLYPGFKITTVYRPLDFRPADRLVLRARMHWGMKLLSRKDGLLGLRKSIASGDSIGIFFDQNALSGALILSFGQVCSTTDLPGILAAKLHLPCYLVNPVRTGFLRAQFAISEIENDGTVGDITARTSLYLENILRGDEEACSDWMWAHRRWNSVHARAGSASLNLDSHRNFLAESLRAAGLAAMPRRQPFCLRLPANPSLANIAAGWLPRLRAARPDVRWIVVSPSLAASAFREGENCERLVTFNRGGIESALRTLRTEYTQIYFSLEPDCDLRAESNWCRSEYQIGISTRTAYRKARKVAFITAPERLEMEAFDALLADFFAYCGLRAPSVATDSAREE